MIRQMLNWNTDVVLAYNSKINEIPRFSHPQGRIGETKTNPMPNQPHKGAELVGGEGGEIRVRGFM